MTALLWIPFAALLAVYCGYEKKQNFRTATALKVALSGLIALLSAIAFLRLSPKIFAPLMLLLGLICAVPADYFLQYIRADFKRYRYGIFFFGAMHACLLTGYFVTWGVAWVEFAVMAAMLAVLLFFQLRQKWDLGPARTPLSLYTVLVTLMAAKSVSIGLLHPGPPTLFLALGGGLFFVSDLFLGLWNYHDDRFLFLALNRVIYFTGQMCFAFALLSFN